MTENTTPADTAEEGADKSPKVATAPVAAPEVAAPEDAAIEDVSGPAEPAPSAMATLDASAVASGDLPIGLRALIDAGVHFGHQTKRWNPRMRPFIYGARNGIHIIDLDQTAQLFKRAYQFVSDAVARGGHVLMVGTKRQAAEVIREEAIRAGQFYVTGRWLGGTLTNFRTVKSAIERLRELERQDEEGELDLLTKKEAIRLRREKDKLEKYIGGIKLMNALPSVIFVIDPQHEHIAVREGRKLHVPIVALTDTNCDPDLIDFVVPGNDDAIRSIKLVTSRIADACIEGAGRRRDGQQGYAPQTAGGVQVEFQRGRRRGGGGGGAGGGGGGGGGRPQGR
jgi:small subunit ribosomal protein S2